MKTFYLTSAIALALLLGVSTSNSWAQDCGCAAAAACGCADGACDGGCGACGGCGAGKVCRLVCEEVEVKATCYGVKHKDICVPGCGSKCTNVDCVKCGECSCDTTAGLCKIKYPTGKPGCAKQKAVKELVKYETKKKVKVWKWEIVDGCGCDGACDGCGAGDGCDCATAGDACGCAS
ncbi:MAG: hypothetical protein OES79_12520 [Planctomycetota bacterium]|nr:hypothetical protein [Planctomycetota bacterium]